MKKKNTLIILTVLFFIFLVGAYFSYKVITKQSTSLPSGYEFLQNFEIESTDENKNYHLKAFIYNSSLEEQSIKFDINTLNTQNSESLYYKDVKIESSKILIQDDTNMFDPLPQLLDMYFIFSNKNDLALEYVLVQKYTPAEEEITQSIKEMYGSLSSEPTVPDNQELYYFNLLSYIENNWEKEYISEIFVKKPNTQDIMNQKKEYIVNNKEAFEKVPFMSNLSFSCTLLKELEKNIGKVDNELKKYYCEENSFIHAIEKLYAFYTTESSHKIPSEQFLESIYISAFDYEKAISYLSQNNTYLSLFSSYWDSDMKKNSKTEEKVKVAVENSYYVYLLTNDSIQNNCALAYSSRIAQERSKGDYYKGILDTIANSMKSENENIVQSLEHDIYANNLCFLAFKGYNEELELLFKNSLYKSLLLNYDDTQNTKTKALSIDILLELEDEE